MKNKNVIIGVIVAIIVVIIIAVVVLKNKESKTTNPSNSTVAESTTVENTIQDTPKNEQTGTAGSNIPLKDNLEEAKNQVEIAMKNWIKETYGDDVVDSKINVTKLYTAEDEQQEPALKERNLGPNEVAFEVSYELKIAEGVKDTIQFTVPTGVFNEQTRWVTEKSNLGILRPDGNGYKITDFGTGW